DVYTGYQGSLLYKDSILTLAGTKWDTIQLAFTLKLDRDFDTLVDKEYRYRGERTFPRSCTMTADGGIAVTGENFILDSTDMRHRRETLVAKLNTQGDTVWTRSFKAVQTPGDIVQQTGARVIELSNGNIVTAGFK